MNPSLTVRAFVALLLNGGELALVALAGTLLVRGRAIGQLRWIVGPLAVALAGYGVFWCGFLHPLAGRVASWVSFGAALFIVSRSWSAAKESIRLAAPWALGTTLFVFAATALLLLYPAGSIGATAQQRFFPSMPGDNDLPRVFADLIRSGSRARVLGGDWLTSDRPPLQTGIALLGWPPLSALGLDFDTACATAGIWFQALWFPVVGMLLRALGLPARAALGATAALGGTAFLVFDTVYVWPKLGAAAFVVAAFLLWLTPQTGEAEAASRGRLALGAACAACGWLAHGGVMFSLVALAPFLIFDARRRRAWRDWARAGGVFLLLALPWLLYQNLYAPPGNRLVKWHIAGVVAPDSRSVLQALRDRYRETGWRGAWDARRQNLRMLFVGDWRAPFDPWAEAKSHRTDDVAFPLRTTAGWTPGLAALLWLGATRNRRLRESARFHRLAAGWLLGGLAVWVALMFSPNSVFTHQGSFVPQLLLLALLAAWAWLAGRIFFGAVAAVQWIGFVATWLAPASAAHATPDKLAAVIAAASGTALVALAGAMLATEEKTPNA